jgi:hypothetical protein
MAFTLRPYRRFPVQCSVSYYGELSIKLPLAYSLGFWLLITLLVLGRGSVYAEWVALETPYQSPGLQTVYVDPATIRRDGHLVTLWQLTDFVSKQGGKLGHRFFSAKTQKQFDCPGRRFRLLAFTDFFGHMGTGAPMDGLVDQDTWLPVEPESLNQGLWEVVCGKP